MVGSEEHFAILETLKRLFQQFSTVFSACCGLRMLLLRRRRKIEKDTFYPNSKQPPSPWLRWSCFFCCFIVRFKKYLLPLLQLFS